MGHTIFEDIASQSDFQTLLDELSLWMQRTVWCNRMDTCQGSGCSARFLGFQVTCWKRALIHPIWTLKVDSGGLPRCATSVGWRLETEPKVKIRKSLIGRSRPMRGKFHACRSGVSLARRGLVCIKHKVSGSSHVWRHPRPLLEASRDTNFLYRVASFLARGQVPPSIIDVIRVGRLTALRKSNGGVRGIMVGEVIWRLVARTVAQQLGPAVEVGLRHFSSRCQQKSGCETWPIASMPCARQMSS